MSCLLIFACLWKFNGKIDIEYLNDMPFFTFFLILRIDTHNKTSLKNKWQHKIVVCTCWSACLFHDWWIYILLCILWRSLYTFTIFNTYRKTYFDKYIFFFINTLSKMYVYNSICHNSLYYILIVSYLDASIIIVYVRHQKTFILRLISINRLWWKCRKLDN